MIPHWIRKKLDRNVINTMEEKLNKIHLFTICTEAKCPNRGECFGKGTATFLILGNICTRNCGFCAVKKGKPLPLDKNEPKRVAEFAKLLGLTHVVVTSVTRDDLPDGGAEQFIDTLKWIRKLTNATVELLVPDFGGNFDALDKLLSYKPDVLNHNIETVPRLYPIVRPLANYTRSLELLLYAKKKGIITKSGLMVGLGETQEEVINTLYELRKAGCDIVTIGQYLRPSRRHLEVARYVHPDEFKYYEKEAYKMGFKFVASAPFVRSSYRAKEALEKTSL